MSSITPVLSFKAENHPLRQPQFRWYSRTEGLEIALYAGKEMMICINDDDKTYQLTYLDMAHPEKFQSIDEAKAAASDFARAVLLYMIAIIGEEDKPHE